MAREVYAAPAVRWGRGRNKLLVYTSRAPESLYIFRSGPLGDHARWMIDMRRKYEWKRWPTWRDLMFGSFESTRPEWIGFVDLPWWTRPLGWALTVWAIREALR